MQLPDDRSSGSSEIRAKLRTTDRSKYPFGKALARTQYFEAQRGLVQDRSSEPPKLAVRGGDAKRARSRAPLKPVAGAVYLRAAKTHLLASKPFDDSIGLPVWREGGPRRIPEGQTYGTGGNNRPPVAGRCNGIVVDRADGRHLVLSSAGGGLWESKDLGDTWRPLTDGLGTLSIGAVLAAPSSPNILYAGTGEGDSQISIGIGLMRSIDGGSTWSLIPNTALAGLAIYDLAVSQTDPSHMWIATTRGLFESKDGGITAAVVLTSICWSVAVNARNPDELIACTASGAFHSQNNGVTFAALVLPALDGVSLQRLEVAFAPSSSVVSYIAGASKANAMLWRRASANGTFQPQTVPSALSVKQAWYDWCLVVAPDSTDEIYWGAIELFKGTRSPEGWRWRNISSRSAGDSIHPDQHHLTFDPNDAAKLYACNDGGLFFSPDRGASWQSLNIGLGITEFEFIVQRESDSAWLMGGTQDNGTLLRSPDLTWHQIALGDGGDCAVVEDPRPCCYHSYYEMPIERAFLDSDVGIRWANVSPPVPKKYRCLFYPPMDASGPLLVKAGVSLWVSENSGKNWAEVLFQGVDDGTLPLVSALSILSPCLILIGTESGAVFRIRRSAQGWSAASVETLGIPRSSAFVSDLVLGADGKTLWASCSRVGGAHVFRSTDAGLSWVNRGGNLPAIPVNALVVDITSSGVLYAATDHGVYQTSDEGDTWRLFSNGLPHAIVSDLILHEASRTLRAGTRSRGVWEITI